MTVGPDKINITLKAGMTQDSPWITIDRRTPAELLGVLGVPSTNDPASDLKALMDTVAKSSAYFAGVFQTLKGNAPAPAQNNAPANNGGGQRGEPAGATSAPAGGPGNCEHGLPYKYSQGVNKETGKPYSAYYCTFGKFKDPNRCPPVYTD